MHYLTKNLITNLQPQCDEISRRDPDLAAILAAFGYPPAWTRPNTFESLVWIILEQQVSLASAKAALEKLRLFVDIITPDSIIGLDDSQLKSCYVSRQKAAYIRGLARSILDDDLNLTALEQLPDDEVRTVLTQLKGIGTWTADIYLLFVLHRTDVFPAGDLAARQALARIKRLPQPILPDDAARIAADWQPYRSAATMLLWHYYLSSRPAGRSSQ